MTGPIRELDPETYQRHLIHGEDRVWAETNCYVDVLIELLHGLGFEPIAALPFTFRIDFEGDQWTFFKFPHVDVLKPLRARHQRAESVAEPRSPRGGAGGVGTARPRRVGLVLSCLTRVGRPISWPT